VKNEYQLKENVIPSKAGIH